MVDYNYTDITIIMDRSGSMHAIKSDAEGGINDFIQEQSKTNGGKKLLTVIGFDDAYEVMLDAKEISAYQTPYIKLEPRGMTALLDAVGKTINRLGERFRSLPDHERPGKILIFVITDGFENCSREFTKQAIKDMIKHQEEIYQWQFIYLGANQDAFEEGQKMGFCGLKSATFTPDKIDDALRAMSRYTSTVCCSSAVEYQDHICSGGFCFTDKDRASLLIDGTESIIKTV
jgi:hypothetical protein